jgi:hypothetical protein
MAIHTYRDTLRNRGLQPFLWTQFLGAGNDNIYKNALVIFVAFHAATLTSLDTTGFSGTCALPSGQARTVRADWAVSDSTVTGTPIRKSARALPVFVPLVPLNEYEPRVLTPRPRPSMALLRFQSAPAFSECPPMTQVRLSLTENAFWVIVRSALKPPSLMLTGLVLLAPPVPPRQLGTNVLIAWNCSTEQARTTALAMPLLKTAERVTVLSVKGGNEVPGPPADQAVQYLQRNGVGATLLTVDIAGRTTGDGRPASSPGHRQNQSAPVVGLSVTARR